MVAVLVVLTIAALLTTEYVLLRRRSERVLEAHDRLTAPRALADTLGPTPKGVFLQPTFTWTRVERDGTVVLGVHPMLLGLVGAPYTLDRRRRGEPLRRGDALLQIGAGAHAVEVRSPIAGRIVGVNRRVRGEQTWEGVAANDGSWMYRIAPDDLGNDVPTWMVADGAARWSGTQYDRVRTHLMRLAERPDIGVTMADGGDVPIGVLRQLDDAGWVEFAAVFL